MDEQSKFQFSLRNMFLMMLPLAVLFAIAARGLGFGWPVATLVPGGFLLGSAAIGALMGDWRGMGKGLAKGYLWYAAIAGAWILVLLIISLVRGIVGHRGH